MSFHFTDALNKSEMWATIQRSATRLLQTRTGQEDNIYVFQLILYLNSNYSLNLYLVLTLKGVSSLFPNWTLYARANKSRNITFIIRNTIRNRNMQH